MTIDEAIKYGEQHLSTYNGEPRDFIETALDTMKKQRRIIQLVPNYKRYGSTIVWRINEVLEGRIDKI